MKEEYEHNFVNAIFIIEKSLAANSENFSQLTSVASVNYINNIYPQTKAT